MYIGGDTGCVSCTQRAQELLKQTEAVISDEWLSREQVKEICEPCYNNMVKNNISKIKKASFLEKFQGNKMKFYEIIYKGPEKSKLHLAGRSVDAGGIIYFAMDELPFPEKDLPKLPNTVVNIVERDKKPTPVEVKVINQSTLGKVGIKWTGTSPMRSNEHGHFKRDEVVYVEPHVAEKLKANSGFKSV